MEVIEIATGDIICTSGASKIMELDDDGEI